MSNEQTKPTKKWYQSRLLYLLVIILLLVMVGICVMAVWPPVGGHPGTCRECAYDSAKIELQNAVKDYQNKNNGALPTINGTVTINGSVYQIINICPLLTQNEESLQTVIESLWCGNGSNDDNWDGGCSQCYAASSYIWAADDEGNVYSTCVGRYCNASGVDGYQDRWP
jgi:hypothetical protein